MPPQQASPTLGRGVGEGSRALSADDLAIVPDGVEFLPPPRVAASGSELRGLGESLLARSSAVLELTVAQTREASAGAGAPEGADGLAQLCTLATNSVARRMAGAEPFASEHAEEDVLTLLRRHVVEPGVPLGDATRLCLRWRDATSEVLNDCARQLDISSEARVQALAMVQMALDRTLLHMCTAFDEQRRETHEQLAVSQEELAYAATHDALTGLPNRALMLERGSQMLLRARRHRTPVAALAVDLDDFKSINDTFGHEVGDELLRAIAARLRGVVRESDAVGRIGGDEFLLIVDELTLAAGAEVVAERVQEALREPLVVGDQTTYLTITASVGIASGERISIGDLLRDADVALYHAKRDDRTHLVFQQDMHTAVQSRLELAQDLRRATSSDEFFLVYQPTFDLRDMSPTGMEALIRWRHPVRGVVAPNEFVPLLEQGGLIVDIGRWVLEQACIQGARWREEGFDVGVAVNVSALQLERDEFVEQVADALSASGMTPSALTLEITESTLMRDPQATARRLTAIKALGARLAIDDFGTGYSSLSHLQQLPVDSLKIDRSFVCQLSGNPDGEKLIHTLVQLGKALSIETLAEGIEQQDELSLLRDEQCDSGQGFLFAKPLSPEAASAFLQNWKLARDQQSPTYPPRP
jgi:diguanylate cyclase (GGDEF)-like protein